MVERLHTDVPEGVNYHPYLPREDGRLPMSDFGGVHRYNVTGLHHDIWGFPTQNATQIVKAQLPPLRQDRKPRPHPGPLEGILP